jgi:CheY-like chemotaxis protein
MNFVFDQAAAGVKMLVVDDEPIIRQRLQELGENLGFEVAAAANGVEAIRLFRRISPDIVVLDLYMPGINGLTVMAKMREIDPECPIILITGYLSYDKLVQVSSGICPDGCLEKPLSIAKTANMILDMVGRRDLEQLPELEIV